MQGHLHLSAAVLWYVLSHSVLQCLNMLAGGEVDIVNSICH